jgi:hypothetical protein
MGEERTILWPDRKRAWRFFLRLKKQPTSFRVLFVFLEKEKTKEDSSFWRAQIDLLIGITFINYHFSYVEIFVLGIWKKKKGGRKKKRYDRSHWKESAPLWTKAFGCTSGEWWYRKACLGCWKLGCRQPWRWIRWGASWSNHSSLFCFGWFKSSLSLLFLFELLLWSLLGNSVLLHNTLLNNWINSMLFILLLNLYVQIDL